MSGNIKRFIGINLAVTLTLGIVLGGALVCATALKAHAAESAAVEQGAPAKAPAPAGAVAAACWGAALAVLGGCLAAGIAVGMTGSAAIGAISERPELFGRTIVFVGLAEGIAIYGLVIAIMILVKV